MLFKIFTGRYVGRGRNVQAVYVSTMSDMHECVCWDYSIDNRKKFNFKENNELFFLKVE